MRVVIRHFRGGAELIDELVDRRKDVEELIRGVDGFVAYYLVKTADGGASSAVNPSQRLRDQDSSAPGLTSRHGLFWEGRYVGL